MGLFAGREGSITASDLILGDERASGAGRNGLDV